VRKSGVLQFLRPDSKSQVSVEYVNGKPSRIDTVVISTQHTPDVTHKQIEEGVMEEVIKKVLPAELLDAGTRYYINPTGRSLSAVPWATASDRRKSSVTPTAAWAVTAVAHSPARILPSRRSQLTWGVMWPKTCSCRPL
jgi:hypothetical protein